MKVLFLVGLDGVGARPLLPPSEDMDGLRAYADVLYGVWKDDREIGLRAGGAQIWLADVEHVRTRGDGTLLVEIAQSECLVDDCTDYVEWCDRNGHALSGHEYVH